MSVSTNGDSTNRQHLYVRKYDQLTEMMDAFVGAWLTNGVLFSGCNACHGRPRATGTSS